jgi:hypothetical protein
MPVMQPPTPRAVVFETYWRFAAERHGIFESRLTDPDGPWTNDPILSEYRFCNAFRACDRVSQDLIRVIYEDPASDIDDVCVRVLLHRLFSKPETWELIDEHAEGLNASSFDADALGEALDAAHARGLTLYTNAFILCASPSYGHPRKHRNHLALVAAMLKAGLPSRLEECSDLKAMYDALLEWPLIGPFMAYQLATDLNYSPAWQFDENEFTMPGPGALRGLAKIFADLGELTPAGAVHWLVDDQRTVHDELGISPPTLFGRALHAIDCQNLLCEVDKYCRVAFPELQSNRSRIKQRFTSDARPYDLFFPPHWNLSPDVPRIAGRECDPEQLFFTDVLPA